MNTKRITSLFIIALFFLITTVSFVVLADKDSSRAAVTVRVLGISTYDYCSGFSNLDNQDAEIFSTQMGVLGNTVTYLKNEGFPPMITSCANIAPTPLSNYVYFTGHGDTQTAFICDYSDSANPIELDCTSANSIGTPAQYVNDIIFASCNTVNSLASWKNCFSGYNGILKCVMGYYKESYDSPVDDSVATEMVKQLKAFNFDFNKGERHVEAWMKANQVDSSTSKIWSAIAYRDYDKKLTYWQKDYTHVSPHPWNGGPIRDFNPTLNLMNGRILVYTELDRSVPDGMCEWETQPEKLDTKKFDIFSRSQNGIVRNYRSGAFIFEQDGEPYRGKGIDSSEALGIAETFVSQNGGIPEDSFLSEIAEINCKDLETDAKDTEGYYFLWRQKFEGNVVAGGNAIHVTVKNGKVIQYYRKVTTPEKKVNTERLQFLTKEDALRAAGEDIIRSVKTTRPISITAVDTVYYSEGINSDDKRLIPAYILILEGGSCMFVDARTGTLLW